MGSTRREKKGGNEGKVKSQKLVLSGLLKIHKNKGFSELVNEIYGKIS